MGEVTPFYRDDWLTIFGGDNREVMATLPSGSVHCVVTSPPEPYWGLRDYGTATWSGGVEGCRHAISGQVQDSKWAGAIVSGVRPGADASKCLLCGAIRQDSQLGLEATPEEYVANLMAVFREVRRVLRDDGTLWLNLGDSYARGQESNVPQTKKGGAPSYPEHAKAGSSDGAVGRADRPGSRTGGLAQKQLVGIPWRVAFALQADGWYLRSDIIWAKPNPMPESVTDRPTKAHEYLFLLSKSPRYYFDQEAVREAAAEWPGHDDAPQGSFNGKNGDAAFRAIRPAGRNLRSVWTIATRPYPGAHFAVFPPELPERCIKAGSPEGGVILDPFAGSGTVGLVANRLSRRAVLIDLNPSYLEQQMLRNAQVPVGL